MVDKSGRGVRAAVHIRDEACDTAEAGIIKNHRVLLITPSISAQNIRPRKSLGVHTHAGPLPVSQDRKIARGGIGRHFMGRSI